jgi:hypothetical protein
MKFEMARDEFLVRFYRWSLEDYQRHNRENFALFRACPDLTMVQFLRFLEPLSLAEREVLGPALVKRFHKRAVEVSGEVSTPAEAKCVERYNAGMRNLQQDVFFEKYSQVVSTRLKRKVILAAAELALAPVVHGATKEIVGQQLMTFTTEICGFHVQTAIDVGGRMHELSYCHAIVTPTGLPLDSGTNLLYWLGIAGKTCWDLLTTQNLPAACDVIAQACSRFLTALPGLLAGITVEK